MARIASAIYAAHMNSVLKLAARKGGVSRSQLMDELNVGYGVAGTLITKCDLELDHKEGRTQFFAANGSDPADPKLVSLPPEVKEAAVATTAVDRAVESALQVLTEDEDEIAQLDAEIVDTRNALKEAAAKAGKALGEWATNQALVDSLRERMTDLATRRMNASS